LNIKRTDIELIYSEGTVDLSAWNAQMSAKVKAPVYGAIGKFILIHYPALLLSDIVQEISTSIHHHIFKFLMGLVTAIAHP